MHSACGLRHVTCCLYSSAAALSLQQATQGHGGSKLPDPLTKQVLCSPELEPCCPAAGATQAATCLALLACCRAVEGAAAALAGPAGSQAMTALLCNHQRLLQQVRASPAWLRGMAVH